MGIICGWLGRNQKLQPASIDKMFAAATGHAETSPSVYTSDFGTVCIYDEQPAPDFYFSKDICVVIEGHPEWEDPVTRPAS